MIKKLKKRLNDRIISDFWDEGYSACMSSRIEDLEDIVSALESEIEKAKELYGIGDPYRVGMIAAYQRAIEIIEE